MGRVLLVALLNTLLVSALAIVTASLLGLLIGVMRLSSNWLVKNLALTYIEAIRNTPQLVQIFFVYVWLVSELPGPRQSIPFPGGLLLNNRGLYFPAPIAGDTETLFSWIAAGLMVAIPLVWRLRWRGRAVGAKSLLLAVLALALFAAGVQQIDYPTLKGFNIVGGSSVPPELVALWAGLSIYSAAFIAEIVRGSIEAVPKGQHEAALSLGLTGAQRLFLITLPQALRIMVPPLTSQYLNVIKSSSLGEFIAYPELVQMILGTVMQQSNREIETVLMVGGIFLSISLLTSAFMNWYNRHVALVER
jgi:general L-amino acid transport system permease protein